MEYQLARLVHVVAAIVAVGSNLTYWMWLRAAGRDRDRLRFVITGIRRIDRRLALPAYLVLLGSGLVMASIGPFHLFDADALWLTAGLGLYIVVAVLGVAAFAPALRRLLAASEIDPESAASRTAARTTDRLFVITVAAVATILVLMLLKPF